MKILLTLFSWLKNKHFLKIIKISLFMLRPPFNLYILLFILYSAVYSFPIKSTEEENYKDLTWSILVNRKSYILRSKWKIPRLVKPKVTFSSPLTERLRSMRPREGKWLNIDYSISEEGRKNKSANFHLSVFITTLYCFPF